MEDQGHQAMWPQMIAALAAIDAELGIPDDGCNSLAQTLAAIRALKAKAEIAQAMARTAMAGAEFTPLRARGVVDADNNLDCWDTEPFEICHDHVAALNEKDPAAMWRVIELFGRELGPNVSVQPRRQASAGSEG